MKKSLIVLMLLVGAAYSDGMPEYLFKDNVIKVTNVSKVSTTKPVKKISSYQVLKNKYEAEAEYSDELRERILKLQDVVYNKDKVINDTEVELDNCLSRDPVIIEKEPEGNSFLMNIVIFISGMIAGNIL